MIISISQDDILRVINAIKKNSKENVECAGQGMPFVKTKVVDADYVLTMLQELIEKEDDNLCNSCTNIGTVEAIPKDESVTPQEPFINKPCVSSGVCEHDKNKVLDKIRAEIEQVTSRYSISRERGGMGKVEWSDNLIKESEVLKILDKYRAESDG